MDFMLYIVYQIVILVIAILSHGEIVLTGSPRGAGIWKLTFLTDG